MYNAQPINNIRDQNAASEKFVLRILEALLFSSQSPMAIDEFYAYLPQDFSGDVHRLLRQLQAAYEGRGIEIIEINKKWVIRTAPDLADFLVRDVIEQKKLPKATLETLSIIAYHQPTTRAEIESIRGVAVSKGTLDTLMEMGWIRLGKRRETPGRPVTFITTDSFLEHFGLRSVKDLPGLKELKDAGFLDSVGHQITDAEMKSLLEGQERDALPEEGQLDIDFEEDETSE